MKKNIVTLFVCILCSLSCSKADKNPMEDGQVESTKELIDTTKNEIDRLEHRIAAFENDVKHLKAENDELASKVIKLQDNKANDYFWLLAVGSVLGLLGAILSIRVWRTSFNDSDWERIENRMNDYKSKVDQLAHFVAQSRGASSSVKSMGNEGAISGLEKRLSKMEIELETLLRTLQNQQAKNVHSTKELINVPPQQPREGYFGMVKGNGFFNDVYYSLREECLFKVTFLSDNEAEFEPIDIRRIKSVDGIEPAIQYSGSCSMHEATSFELSQKGIVEKTDNYWRVIRPAKITIFK